MARIAVGLTEDKNKKAAQKANKEFYTKHPEMKGKPIDPCDPEQAKYQKEWMDSYVKHGGAYRIGKYETTCSKPEEQTCPCDGSLVVIVESKETKEPVPFSDVEIFGPRDFYDKGQTDEQGKATFSGLEEELYWIDVRSLDNQVSQGTAQVHCRQTSEVLLSLVETGTLVVDVIDQFKMHVPNVTVYAAPGSDRASEKRTDGQGQAIFEDLPPGNYQISAGVLQKSGREIHYKNSMPVTITEGRTSIVLDVIATCEVPLVWVDDLEITSETVEIKDQPSIITEVQNHSVTLKQKSFVPIDHSLVGFDKEKIKASHNKSIWGDPVYESVMRYTAKYRSDKGSMKGDGALDLIWPKLPIPSMSLTPDKKGFEKIINVQVGRGVPGMFITPTSIQIGFTDETSQIE
jgi:hypothetical protein